jgi:hypothetical protein
METGFGQGAVSRDGDASLKGLVRESVLTDVRRVCALTAAGGDDGNEEMFLRVEERASACSGGRLVTAGHSP